VISVSHKALDSIPDWVYTGIRKRGDYMLTIAGGIIIAILVLTYFKQILILIGTLLGLSLLGFIIWDLLQPGEFWAWFDIILIIGLIYKGLQWMWRISGDYYIRHPEKKISFKLKKIIGLILSKPL
jgi:hypothetical protein